MRCVVCVPLRYTLCAQGLLSARVHFSLRAVRCVAVRGGAWHDVAWRGVAVRFPKTGGRGRSDRVYVVCRTFLCAVLVEWYGTLSCTLAVCCMLYVVCCMSVLDMCRVSYVPIDVLACALSCAVLRAVMRDCTL